MMRMFSLMMWCKAKMAASFLNPWVIWVMWMLPMVFPVVFPVVFTIHSWFVPW